jgi:hypothetical protein
MDKSKKVNPRRLGIVMAITLALIGFIIGIFGYFGMGVASAKMESSINSVFKFMKHSETNLAMFGGMTLRIGKYVGDGMLKKAHEKNDQKSIDKIKKIFPKDDIEEYEIEDITAGLDGIQGVLVSQLQHCLGITKWLLLVGLSLGLAIFGFVIGFLGGVFYNRFG